MIYILSESSSCAAQHIQIPKYLYLFIDWIKVNCSNIHICMLILALKLETADPATQSVCSAYFPPIYIILIRHRVSSFIFTSSSTLPPTGTDRHRAHIEFQNGISSSDLLWKTHHFIVFSGSSNSHSFYWFGLASTSEVWVVFGRRRSYLPLSLCLKKIKHTFNSTISLHIDSVTHERHVFMCRCTVPPYRTELTNEKSRRYFCFRIFAVCIQITFGAELSIFISLLSFGIQFERYAIHIVHLCRSLTLSLSLVSSFHLLSLYINRRHRAHNLFAFRFGISRRRLLAYLNILCKSTVNIPLPCVVTKTSTTIEAAVAAPVLQKCVANGLYISFTFRTSTIQ